MKLTRYKLEQVQRKLDAGHSVDLVSKQLGVSPNAVRRAREKNKQQRRKRQQK